MKVKALAGILSVAAIFALEAPKAQADSILELISGHSTQIVDGVNGVATYDGAVGGWNINVTTGLASPADGGVGDSLDVDSVDFSASGTSASLTILWSADGYTSTGPVLASIGGTSSTGMSFSTFYGPSLLSMANALTPTMSFGSGAFSGTTNGVLSSITPYAMTEELCLSGGKVGTMLSFDASVALVPDGGSTVILLGGAMTAIALIRRAGKQK